MLRSDSSNETFLVRDIEDIIEIHFKQYKILYPDIPVTAKQYFLIHYPRCFRWFGPPLNNAS